MPNMISLNQDTEAIEYLCKKDKRLAKVISTIGPITYPVHTDSYAFLIHEIIEQMLSVKAAAKIYDRLMELCDGNICVSAINQLSDEQIRGIGTSRSKVKYIRGLTDAIVSGYLNFKELETMNDAEVISKLTTLHGIGTWTAKMYLIFALNRQDVCLTKMWLFCKDMSGCIKQKTVQKQQSRKNAKNGSLIHLSQQDIYTGP